MNPEKVSIYGVGDVLPNRPNPESLFELALPTLKQADILFGQLEIPLSEKGEPQMQDFPVTRVSPERVSGLTYAGFHVMSFACNQALNLGEVGLFETIKTLTKNNIAVIGAGKNIDEARKPLILERKGTKVGFLAYCSVLPRGYEARADKSGCAPMRATTAYEQVDWQPGTPPKILTFANKGDLAAMVEDIKKLRPLVDVVIMSIHWGVHFAPAKIAMYEKEVGYAAIDAGVDLILGHHPHVLKAVEVYKGKTIFYSIGNFVQPSKKHRGAGWATYKHNVDPDYPDYDYGVDERKSMITKFVIGDKRIQRISYFPVMINGHAQPEVLPRSDKRSSEVYEYLQWCCQDQGIDTEFSWDGDEVVIHT